MITTHQFLKKYPIDSKSEKLIVGTIHPHNIEAFEIPFFYGNVTSIWRILDKASNGKIGNPITLDGIRNFLTANKISVSDTIIQCERKTPSALDKDLLPLELNYEMVMQIRNSDINKIFFTSGFEKNNAFKLFYEDILQLKITNQIKSNRTTTLDEKIFGKPVELIVLYSPSGTANTGLIKSKLYLANKEKYLTSVTPVQDFKIDYYREKFKFSDE